MTSGQLEEEEALRSPPDLSTYGVHLLEETCPVPTKMQPTLRDLGKLLPGVPVSTLDALLQMFGCSVTDAIPPLSITVASTSTPCEVSTVTTTTATSRQVPISSSKPVPFDPITSCPTIYNVSAATIATAPVSSIPDVTTTSVMPVTTNYVSPVTYISTMYSSHL